MHILAIAIAWAHWIAGAAQDPPVRAIGVGERYACALLDSGDVRCWGDGSPKPASIGLSGIVALGVGPQHACAAGSDGIWCWGRNHDGELGDGTTTDRATPVKISTMSDVVELVADEVSTCARTTAGAVYCWGHASCVGHSDRTSALTPGRVKVPPATRLVAGDATTCAFFVGAPPRCWGFYTPGLSSSGEPAVEPVASLALEHADALAIGHYHACIVQQGWVSCAGEDQFGQLGDQPAPDDAQCREDHGQVTCALRDHTTRKFPALRGFVSARSNGVALAASDGRTCAITDDSTVRCWGQWYDFDDWAHHTPNDIAGARGAVAIAVSAHFGCALLADHTVRCWGFNESGELGRGTVAPSLLPASPAEPVHW